MRWLTSAAEELHGIFSSNLSTGWVRGLGWYKREGFKGSGRGESEIGRGGSVLGWSARVGGGGQVAGGGGRGGGGGGRGKEEGEVKEVGSWAG